MKDAVAEINTVWETTTEVIKISVQKQFRLFWTEAA
jgi:hypothetical protein